MRKFYFILSSLLLLTVAAQADDYNYLTVQQSDGTEQSFTASGLTITFSGTQMQVTQSGSTTAFTLADLNKMYFAESATGIESIESENADGQGATQVYDLQGRRVNNQQLQNGQQPKGIYVVKSKGTTQKVTVK